MYLTIAIPTYNSGKTIERTLDSVVSQICDGVEVLISDNASSDNSDLLIQNYIKKYKFIRYIKNNVNLGADANFLNCYKFSKGDFVYLLGSDDILVEGAIRSILSFVKVNEQIDLLFVNHYFFVDNDYSLTNNKKNLFLPLNRDNYITKDKNKFIKDAKYQLGFIGAMLLSKKAFKRVSSPEKYIGSFFIHTCLAFEGTKEKNCNLGVLYTPVVAQDLSQSSSSISNRYFEVFGEKEFYVLCEIAPKYGYSLCVMKDIFFSHVFKNWPRAIINMRLADIPNWKEQYQKNGKKIVLQSLKLRLFMWTCSYCPISILVKLKLVYKLLKSLF